MTHVYDVVEKLTGIPIIPSGILSEKGSAFWRNRKACRNVLEHDDQVKDRHSYLVQNQEEIDKMFPKGLEFDGFFGSCEP